MPFSTLDQSIIRNSMLSKSDKDIAALLGCSTADVHAYISNQLLGTNIVSRQMKLEAKRPAKKPKIKAEKKQNPAKTIRQIKQHQQKLAVKEQKQKNLTEKYLAERRSKNETHENRRRYKTREVDYSKLILVKIDSKTSIYIKPGQDAEIEKERFLKNFRTEGV